MEVFVVCTDLFHDLAKTVAKSFDVGAQHLVSVGHPVGGIDEEELGKKMSDAAKQIMRILNHEAGE